MKCSVCPRALPEAAVLHGDEFCSTECARAFYGCPLPATKGRAYDHACTGCHNPLDENTDGCDHCTRRHRRRGLGEAARGRSGEAVRAAASPSTADTFEKEAA